MNMKPKERQVIIEKLNYLQKEIDKIRKELE